MKLKPIFTILILIFSLSPASFADDGPLKSSNADQIEHIQNQRQRNCYYWKLNSQKYKLIIEKTNLEPNLSSESLRSIEMLKSYIRSTEILCPQE